MLSNLNPLESWLLRVIFRSLITFRIYQRYLKASKGEFKKNNSDILITLCFSNFYIFITFCVTFNAYFWCNVLKVYSPAASIHFYSRYERSHENVMKNKKFFENLKTFFSFTWTRYQQLYQQLSLAAFRYNNSKYQRRRDETGWFWDERSKLIDTEKVVHEMLSYRFANATPDASLIIVNYQRQSSRYAARVCSHSRSIGNTVHYPRLDRTYVCTYVTLINARSMETILRARSRSPPKRGNRHSAIPACSETFTSSNWSLYLPYVSR